MIGLLLAAMWGLRKLLPKDASALPGEVFQVLGRKPLLGRQQAQVVRFGNKLVLLAVSPLGAESLAEITYPAEVERLTGLCQRTSAFKKRLNTLVPPMTADASMGFDLVSATVMSVVLSALRVPKPALSHR